MIIGARETFIGVKKQSVIDTKDFFNFEYQENFTLPVYSGISLKITPNSQAP